MHLTADEITKLSLPERIVMIGQLWDSLESSRVPITAAQQDELLKRLAHFEEDRSQAMSWENLRSELESRHS